MPKYLNNLDLDHNELQNALVHKLGTAPSSPVEGQIYYDTGTHTLNVRLAASWQSLGAGSGTVTTVSVASANGFAGTVANASSTPAITLTTSITGVLKGNGTAISAATAGTDYVAPGGALGTPASGTLTNCTGLPISTGVSGLATGIATFLATPSSANLAAAVTDEAGSGALYFTGGALGTPASGTLTNATGLPISTGVSGLGTGVATALGNAVDGSGGLASKTYVDSVAQGLDPKPGASVATAAALPACTYANGTSGVGATLTGNSNGALTVDSYAVAAGDIVLVKNQVAGLQNGLYDVTQAGSVGTPFILTRNASMDTTGEFRSAYVVVEDAGTTNANSFWVCTNSADPTVGTTAITFSQLNGATQLTAGTGISISGNTVSLTSGVVTTGTYTAVTVDTYGRVTAGADIVTSNGIVARTASGTFAARTITGTSNRLTVTNGDGVSGAPTLDISSSYVGQATITTLGTVGTGTWQATAVAVLYGGTGASSASAARTNLGATGKYSATIGDGSTTAIAITQGTHGLASNGQMIAQCFDASTGAQVYPDVTINNSNGTVTFTFAVAPTTNQYRIVIMG